jgi:dihydrofolate reductase
VVLTADRERKERVGEHRDYEKVVTGQEDFVGKLVFDITTSLDGFVAGPNDSLELPLGEGGEKLHEWLFGLASWREPHGLEGGETGRDSEVLDEAMRNLGAIIVGRRMFDLAKGWGEEPPFHMSVFVLTHEARDPLVKAGGTTFTFVTDGIESALEQARAAAGDKDVAIGGGANTIQQYLGAGLIDEFQIHIAPLLLGSGVRLFDQAPANVTLETTRVLGSPRVTHLKYRVLGACE